VGRQTPFDNTELYERVDRNLELHFRLSGRREEGGSCRAFIAKLKMCIRPGTHNPELSHYRAARLFQAGPSQQIRRCVNLRRRLAYVFRTSDRANRPRRVGECKRGSETTFERWVRGL
jgi:hypothetical protein